MRLRYLTRRYHRAHFMWWFIVGLIVTPGVFSPLVLCIGGNGHLATETTHVPSPQHDGACLDAPVLSAAEKPSRSNEQLSVTLDDLKPLLTLDAVLTPVESGGAFAGSGPCDGVLCDPILPALRTVLLRV